MARVEPAEGLAMTADDAYPSWPLGIELVSMGVGTTRWPMEAGPEHANPFGAMHGGVRCDIGDAAPSTASTGTLEEGQQFTTVDLRLNVPRPVRSGRLEAVGRVVHRGRTMGCRRVK